MQAGQNPHDPLTQLNSHLGFGAMAGFNPFADAGVNLNDPNMVRPSRPLIAPNMNMTYMFNSVCRQMQNMMNSPEFIQQMSSALSDPRIMDQIGQSMPGGAIPEMFRSEHFQRLVCVEFHCPHLRVVLSYA